MTVPQLLHPGNGSELFETADANACEVGTDCRPCVVIKAEDIVDRESENTVWIWQFSDLTRQRSTSRSI